MGLTILAIILMIPFTLLCMYMVGLAWKYAPMSVITFTVMLLFLAGIAILMYQRI